MKNNSKSFIYYIFLAIVVIFWLSLVSYQTSPFIELKDGDIGIFMAVGRQWINGVPLYTGIFDHKGPLLFMLYGLSYLFTSGFLGVFLVQCGLMIANVLMIYHMTYKRTNKKIGLCCSLIFILFLSFFLEGGGRCEELTLIFSILSLKILYDTLDRQDFYVKNIEAFILGSSFVIIAFIKVNTALIVASVIIFLGLMLLIRDCKKLFKYALYGFLGALVVTLPISLYFYSQGTLSDMLFGTFLFNVKYSSLYGIKSFFTLFFNRNLEHQDFLNLLPFQVNFIIIFSLLFLLILIQYKKKDNNKAFFSSVLWIVSFFCMISSSFHSIYYLIMLSPIVFYIFFEYMRLYKLEILFSTSSLLLLFMSSLLFPHLKMTKFQNEMIDIKQRQEQMLALVSNIPTEERNRLIGFNDSVHLYVDTDIDPYHKYFTLQEWWGQFNPSILEDIQKSLVSNPPLWIMEDRRYPITNKFVLDYIEEQYSLSYQNDYFNIFGRN